MNYLFRIAGSLVFLGCTLPSAQSAEPASNPPVATGIAALRSEATNLLGMLPDKMPGADKDTPAMVQLGKKLYFDTRLSVNNSISCNSCHVVDNVKAGADGEPTSPGAHKKRGDRNSPTVLNAGYQFVQFWDGRAANLEEQAKGPILNPVEMGMPNDGEVLNRLSADAEYPKLFQKAFPNAQKNITYDHVAGAIAAFERTLKTHDRFDDFQKGDDMALKPLEQQGLKLFLQAGCTTCHHGPLLGGNSYQKVGLVNPYENKEDLGRAKVTKDEDDNFKFKVPILRNIALTGPYFHDGKLASLDETVRKMGWMQLGRQFTDDEVKSIVAFLNTLSGKITAQGL